ncbi:phytochelatin synthase [Mesorhizobium sp. M4A.F.Ca.ET.020.02.1.1]|uniref:phytochelatin synthase family protein n=1 Tax=unclassified Mesorhizobium TaxID=325217 RepID=UPI000FCC1E0D|nr:MULTISPECIES: phytochelatin synthase family protein [unclassified Mesorhizobium]RUX43384.1 phytochelatin synthase [Mesorhizobium sp. M4A.F.Ca.ET.050.02.1.1]RVD38418.1 phytochelatin synthase [Mesorhizobium sp. M4A.F.Ca.ET.020.02.1.1]RWC16628.1 MAG: phytochelatin synthase [Mesorhizobium sp.]RWD20558.1 MAG: phytochelatin synthase [Mesorhizobium sp.]RWD28245.1 MAG: phytochelatin synthase [Mesorhizobium sp.]
MRRSLAFGVIAGIGLLCGAAFLIAGPSAVSPDKIQSSVIRAPELIDRAWKLPVAAAFNADVEWQSNASRCGPASVANMFRSIGEEETTEAEVLAGTGKCWTGFCIIGLTLDEVAEVARSKTKRKVSVLRNLTAEEFLAHMKRANDPGRRYIINFTRERIFGAGAGHFSPIGGYMDAEDMVFVLDVNQRYKPWLIERERLFSAMDTIDSDGDRKRGLLLIE